MDTLSLHPMRKKRKSYTQRYIKPIKIQLKYTKLILNLRQINPINSNINLLHTHTHTCTHMLPATAKDHLYKKGGKNK